MVLVSNSTRTLKCIAKYLYFICSLGNLLVGFFLACNNWACIAWPDLVAEKRESLRSFLIHVNDTWSRKVGKAKYKRCNTNDNKKECKVQNTNNKRRCKMQNVKCKMRIAIAIANMNIMPFCICFLSFFYLFSLPF